jgi:hypothetical protein
MRIVYNLIMFRRGYDMMIGYNSDRKKHINVSHNQTKKLNITQNIKFVDNNKLHDLTNTETVFDTNGTTDRKFYISLTTTPTRFYNEAMIGVLENLNNQSVSPTKIFLSFCNKYQRKFQLVRSNEYEKERIEMIRKKIPNVEIIGTNDYGSATKLLGLLEHNKKMKFLKDNDVIIVVDDDMLYSGDLVLSHMLCHDLYNCDVVAVDEKMIVKEWSPYVFHKSDIFYQDDYRGFLYGWLSFSIKYKSTTKNIDANTTPQGMDIFDHYTQNIKQFPNLFYHDDLLFTLYVRLRKLYVVENRFIPLCGIDSRSENDQIDPLRNHVLRSNGTQINRRDLEKKVYGYYKISIGDQSFDVDPLTKEFDGPMYHIGQIPPRSHRLVDGLTVLTDRQYKDFHIMMTYFNQMSIMVTVSVFDQELIGEDFEVMFSLDNISYSLIINLETTKFTHIIMLNNLIRPLEYKNPKKYEIIQTSSENNMCRNKFYSISTILNNSPEFSYKFFNNNDLYQFVKDNYSSIVNDAIQNLRPGAYVADLFRYCYLYLHGGIYTDCKQILYIPMSKYIFGNMSDAIHTNGQLDLYVKDRPFNYAYNAVMVCDKLSNIQLECIRRSVWNIINNQYGHCALSVTGPNVLGDVIDQQINRYIYPYHNTVPKNALAKDSYITDSSGRIVIKNTYHGYYDEKQYTYNGHYDLMWKTRAIYRQNLSKKYKDVKSSDIKMF